jgi:class 3 adenylate cyclase/ABC-type transport system involved in cytochrome c biogenesis ATPase subunit
MDDLADWLARHGLQQYAAVFAANDIDRSILGELSDGDLEKLGLTLGHRRKLSLALRSDAARPEAVPAASAPGAAAPHDAERRQVTVLFCDLVGSTTIARALDPEDMRDYIGRFREAASTAIERYDGFVAKFMGDGVLAYFGYPRASEDSAEHAVRAAIALRDAMARIATPGGEPSRTRTGIATGMVVVGDIVGTGAAREHAIAGDTPNLAARLQSEADANAILIGLATARLLARRFELADLGVRALKGFDAPIRVFEVRGEATAESRFAASRPAPRGAVVGRDAELAFLLARWRRATAREGQAVIVTGEAGMGKSRLVDALARAIPDTERNRVTLQCSPYHVNSALYPVIRHLERAAGFAPEDGADARLDKLEAMLARSQGATDPAAIALLADLLALPTSRYPVPDLLPFQRKAATLAALVDVLKRLAEHAPVLLLLEDAHWIDPSTRELLAKLFEAIVAAPVMVVVTTRPESAPTWPPRDNVAALAVDRLDPAQCMALIADVAGRDGLPRALVDEIVARADGVPLYVEELVKSVVEAMHEHVSVPETLRDSLMSRLDRLGGAKDTAQVAAVIGQQFSYVLLAAVSGTPADTLAAHMESLVEAGLAVREGAGVALAYRFRHALLRDVAYESLLRTRRQALHGLIAHTLVSSFPAIVEAEPELLAHHFAHAGDAAMASIHSERAGDRSAARASMAEAVAHFQAALAQAAEAEMGDVRAARELALSLKLGPALANLRGPQHPEVAAVYDRAQALAAALDDAAALFKSTWGQWYNVLVGRRLDLARDRADTLIALAAKTGDDDLSLEGSHCRWSTAMFRGEFAMASALGDAGAGHYDRARHAWMGPVFGGHDPGVCAFVVAAVACAAAGRHGAAVERLAEGLALAEALRHPPSLGHALMNMLTCRQQLGDDREVVDIARRLRELAERYTLPPYRAHAVMVDGWARVVGGDAEAGLAAMEAEYPRATAVGPMFRFYAMLLVDARLRTGRVAEAGELARTALDTVTEPGVGMFVPELHRLLAATARASGDFDASAASLRTALDIACAQGATLHALRAAIDLARLDRPAAREEGRARLRLLCGSAGSDLDVRERGVAETLLAAGA